MSNPIVKPFWDKRMRRSRPIDFWGSSALPQRRVSF